MQTKEEETSWQHKQQKTHSTQQAAVSPPDTMPKRVYNCNWLRHHFLQDTETENSLYMNYCFSCNKQNYFLLQQGYIFWYGFSVLMCC